MAYPEALKNLIQRVEKTRPERIARRKKGTEYPPMSPSERSEILRYHPDFKEDSRREIRVGVNRGYRVPKEVSDLLEGKSREDPDAVDLSVIDIETDVLVIGGGGAGTAAALLAQENGAKVVIATKLRHGDSNSIMAEGGIQAAVDPATDSPSLHYIDTMGGGHFKNVPELVYQLVSDGPEVIQWLESLGVMLDKFPDGRLRAFQGAGTSRKRMYSTGDLTGTEIMRTIRDEARNRSQNITITEFAPAVELILNEHGECAGALLYSFDTQKYMVAKAKAVVLATGGCGRLHIQGFMTSNHYGATADGLVLGYRAGVELTCLHTMQYHPTGIIFPEQVEGILATEKFRGEGANLLNVDGEQFVNEMEPRDVAASAVIRECLVNGKGIKTPNGKIGVWLDSPMIDLLQGRGTIAKEFPRKYFCYRRFGIDIAREPMLVYPILHYQNGGLKANARCETSVPGLFVAGEVMGGVHGENRLMGNSLLGMLVFGRIAGKNAAIYALERANDSQLTLEHVRKYNRELDEATVKINQISPILLPNYTASKSSERQLRTHYIGAWYT